MVSKAVIIEEPPIEQSLPKTEERDGRHLDLNLQQTQSLEAQFSADAVVGVPPENQSSEDRQSSVQDDSAQEIEFISAPPDGGYGWVVVAAGFVILLFSIGLQFTFGLFFTALVEDFQSTRSAGSLIGSLGVSLLTVASSPSGRLCELYGSRRVVLIGGVLIAIALVLSSFATAIWQLYFTYGLFAGVGMGFCFNPSVVAVGEYFTTKRPFATGITIAGSGFGTFTLAPITQMLIQRFQWRVSMRILSLVMLIGISSAALLLKPLRRMKQSSSANCKKFQLSKLYDFSLLRNKSIAICALTYLIGGFGTQNGFVHLAKFATEVGISHQNAAILLSIVGIGNTSGRFVFSRLAQASPAHRRTLFIGSFYSVGCISILLALISRLGGSQFTLFAVFAIFHGLSFGAMVSVLPVIVIDAAGMDNFARAYGLVVCMQSLGVLVGPIVAGLVADYLQSYTVSFIITGLIVMTAGSIQYLGYKYWVLNQKSFILQKLGFQKRYSFSS